MKNYLVATELQKVQILTWCSLLSLFLLWLVWVLRWWATRMQYITYNAVYQWRFSYSLQPGTKCLWILNAGDQESYLWRWDGWVSVVGCVRSVSSRCRSLRPLRPLSVSVDCTHVYRPCSIWWIREDPLTTYHSLRILYWNGLTTPLSRSRPTGSTWKPQKKKL